MKSRLDANNTSNQRGSEDKNSEPRFLVIGQVARPHGVRGEVSVNPHTDLPERFSWIDEIYIGENPSVPTAVERTRFHKGRPLLKFSGYDTRESVDSLRGQLLQIPEDQAIPLEENEYFLFQLLGLSVETLDGDQLGTLNEVIETGANNVFVVVGAQGEVLIPDIPEVISEIDFENKKMIVDPLPGLLNA